ncbi:MAG: TerB family tellurite resistance protein [Myxococcales bacterium]|nr:TerB family tellurite resistance protein [Myxococcales bacterium]
MSSLRQDVYLALASVGWADGNLDADEVDAIAKLAFADGLDLEEVGALEAKMASPVSFDALDVEGIGAGDRVFVYAVAAWLATLDGELAAGEAEALRRVAEALGLGAETVADVDILVREVAYESGGDRPFDYDLTTLRARAGLLAG